MRSRDRLTTICYLAKLLSFSDTLEGILQALLGRLIIDDFVRRNQDMADTDLVNLAALNCAAHFVYSNDVEAARTAKRLRKFAT
ncbi:MAG: hypothetical protein OEM60_10565, partial [Gammaproteobacteria bacterium]|nr:hypothetical protein [Gammaproteobacteria bacterium]